MFITYTRMSLGMSHSCPKDHCCCLYHYTKKNKERTLHSNFQVWRQQTTNWAVQRRDWNLLLSLQRERRRRRREGGVPLHLILATTPPSSFIILSWTVSDSLGHCWWDMQARRQFVFTSLYNQKIWNIQAEIILLLHFLVFIELSLLWESEGNGNKHKHCVLSKAIRGNLCLRTFTQWQCQTALSDGKVPG